MSTHLANILKNTLLTLQKKEKTAEEMIQYIREKKAFEPFHELIESFEELELSPNEILNNLIGEELFINPKNRRTNQELMEEFLQHVIDNQSPLSARTYRKPIERLLDYLGDTHLFEMKYAQAKGYLDSIKQLKGRSGKTVNAQTINGHHSAVSGFIRFLIDTNEFDGKNLFETLKYEEVTAAENGRQECFSVEECQQLYKALEEMDFNRLTRARTRFLLTLLLETGMRRRDAWLLTVHDLTFEDGEYRYIPSKAKNKKKAEAVVRLTPFLAKQYDEYMKERERVMKLKGVEHEMLFIHYDGTHISERRIGDGLQRLYKATGLKESKEAYGLNCHILRHTFGTRMGEAGHSAMQIAKMMGHTNEKMVFDWYCHLALTKETSETVDGFGELYTSTETTPSPLQ